MDIVCIEAGYGGAVLILSNLTTKRVLQDGFLSLLTFKDPEVTSTKFMFVSCKSKSDSQNSQQTSKQTNRNTSTERH